MRASTGRILLASLLGTAAPVAEAQLWRGPAALEVRVEDNRGKAAAGAQVKLEYLDLEPPAGPPPVATDAKGRAVVGSLAEGRWRLSVSREGFMTYQTELAVRQDGKPAVLSTLQLNVPNAVHTLEVKVARARSAPAPAAPPAPSTPDIAQAPPPPPSRPAPAPRPELTPSAPTPKAEPPAPVPSPTPAQPAPPRPSEAPAPAPATPPAPQPAPSAPPQPAPSPSVQPTPPVPAPAPATPTPPPAPAMRRRSFQDKTCFECKPGESSLTIEQVAPPAAGAAGCGTNLRAVLDGSGGGEPAPGCHILRISLPQGVRYTGYRYEIQDGAEAQDCMAGKDCPAGAARWPLDPVLKRSQEGTIVISAFENRSPDRERRAILTVYYTQGGGARRSNR